MFNHLFVIQSCFCNNYLDILFKAFDLKRFVIENQY